MIWVKIRIGMLTIHAVLLMVVLARHSLYVCGGIWVQFEHVESLYIGLHADGQHASHCINANVANHYSCWVLVPDRAIMP